MDNNFIVITPVRDEEKYIEKTLISVTQQTLKPKEWIIVNDGSTDQTTEIVKKYMANCEWINLVSSNAQNKSREVGAKVVTAFNVGYKYISSDNYSFIVKLDGDLTLPKNYFEAVADEFRCDPKIGICGGYCVVPIRDNLIEEKSASYHSRGPIKAYRKDCFDQIGGLKPVLGWDGIDEFTAMYHGWEVKIIRSLQVIHHRPTGNESGQSKISFRLGIASYQMGYDPLLALFRAIKKGFTKPYVINGILFYCGYVIAFLKREPKNVSRDIEKFIKRFQYQRILRLKI